MHGFDWVFLALLSAFMLATSDALTKKALSRENEYLVAWFRLLFSLPPLIVALLIEPAPQIGEGFWTAFLIALPVELGTIVLYVRALKVSPLSLSLPFLALTPVFLISVSYFVLGEEVSARGAAGILLIAAGGYTLNLSGLRDGLLAPVRAVFREEGSVLMICVAFLYSITSSMGKKAIGDSSPVFFGATYFIALAVCFTPLAFMRGGADLRAFLKSGGCRRTVLPGLCYGIMVLSHMAAMNRTQVAYMVSVKRTSLLMGVLYGYVLFREGDISRRLAGALLMFCGFVLVVTAG
ncbi:MAG: hypothetical protein OHK006_01670 [Thermodesulfovibrionales bacterium]